MLGDITFRFCPINQYQLEENIKKFGRLTRSITVNDVHRCESVFILLAFSHFILHSSFLY